MTDQLMAWASKLVQLEADRKLNETDGNHRRADYKATRFEELWWDLECRLDNEGWSDNAIQELFNGITDGLPATEAWARMETIQDRNDQRIESQATMALAHGF